MTTTALSTDKQQDKNSSRQHGAVATAVDGQLLSSVVSFTFVLWDE
jgi:hypothetical protein